MTIKKLLLFWIVFLFVYLVGINATPIFEDEAEYLLLADQLVKTHNPWIYLQNGIFPMYGYLVALVTPIFDDSLVAGRVLNIFLASSLIFWVYKIGNFYKLPSHFVWIANLLLVFSPILLLNARIALLDTPVLVFTAWYIYFTAEFVKTQKKLSLLGLFVAFSLALLTKLTALFGLLTAVVIVSFDIQKHKLKLLHIKVLAIYSVMILLLIILYLFFSKQIQEVTTSSVSLGTNLENEFNQSKHNIFLTLNWLKVYYSQYLIAFLVLIPTLKSIKKNDLYIPMFIWIISSLFGMILFNQFYYPRHILMILIPLIIIASLIISNLPKKTVILLVALIIITKIDLTWKIFSDLPNAQLALEDKFSYFENYTSGETIKDISSTLSSLSGDKQLTVWLDGSYVLEYGLRRELRKEPNIEFKSFRLDENFFQHGLEKVHRDGDRETYAIVNRWAPENVRDLKLIKSFIISFRHAQYLYLVP